MSVIDNRVVEMEFDNSNFESNVKTSMNTLDKLKESLNFSGVSNSFDSISDAAGKVDMSGLDGAVEAVANQFSALELVAISVLANIANKAVEAGMQLVASMSVDQISAGWSKFAENTANIGTLVAQGFDLDTVEEQMDRLLWFTDETSYNYTDMVNSIGKFTATGQGLEDSVNAMEGIANWAAVSGANATKASSAMDVLSKAMSTGYMNLGYYRSIQNLSMDTTEFRQHCLDAAVACGTLTDNLDGTYTAIQNGGTFDISGFTNELSYGAWLTSDVLMQVFEDYSAAVDDIYEYSEEHGITASEAIDVIGDSVDEFGLKAFLAGQEARSWGDAVDSVKDAASTGWMNIFTDIFGNYEEATELWTDLSEAMYNVFVEGLNSTIEVLDAWHELGGRTILLDAFWEAWENVGEIVGTVKDAFRDVFPAMTVESLMSFTEGLKNLAESLKLSDETLANIQSTFRGFFSVIDIGVQFVSALFNGFVTLVSGLAPVGSGILSITGSIGDLLFSFDQAIKESDIFNTVIQAIANFLVDAIQAVIDFGRAIKEWLNFPDLSDVIAGIGEFISMVTQNFAIPGFEALKEIFKTIIDRVGECLSSIFNFRDSTVEAFDEAGNKISHSTFFTVLESIWNAVKKVADVITTVLGEAIQGIISAISNADINGFFDVLNDIFTGGVLLGIIDLVKNLSGVFKDLSGNLSGLTDSVVGVLNSFGDVLSSWSLNIKSDALIKIAGAVGILTLALMGLSGLDSESLGTSIAAITTMFIDLVAAMTAFQKFAVGGSDSITGAVTNFIDSFSNAKQYTNLIKMAAAIGILALALKEISTISDTGNLVESLGGITALFADLTGSMVVLSKFGGATSGFTTMLALAESINILADALEQLSGLDMDEIGTGLLAVTGLCADLVASMKLLSGTSGSMSASVEVLAIAEAVNMLGTACRSFADMNWEEIAKGLAGVGGVLAELDIFINTTSGASGMLSTSVAMIAIAEAMKVMYTAVSEFGSMNWDEIARGLVAMGGALAEVTIAVNLMPSNMISLASGLVIMGEALKLVASAVISMSSMSWEEIAKGLVAMGGALAEMAIGLNAMTGTLSGSAALLVAAAGVDALVPGLKALGNMSVESIAKALITLAAAFTELGIAGAVLGPMATTILELSASFTLLGAGVLAMGVGLAAAGAGIASIAAGVTALAAAFSVGGTAIVSAIEAIILGIVELIPSILEAIGQGIVDICGVIADGAPTIGEAVKAVILTLIDVFVECIPALVDGACEMLLGVVNGMVEYAPQIVSALMQMISGVIDAIAENIPDIVSSVMNLIGAIFGAIIDELNGLDTSSLVDMIATVGLLSALVVALAGISAMVPAAMAAVLELGVLVAEMTGVLAAIGALNQIPGLDWLVNEGSALLSDIGNAIGAFAGNIIAGFLGGVSSSFPKIGEDLSGFMNNVKPFIEGASQIDASMVDGVKSLAECVLLLTASDILEGLTSWLTGGSSLTQFGEELAEFGPYFAQYAESVDGLDAEVVSASANAALTLAEMADTLPNSGGLAGKIFGENSLAEFAEELAEFGPVLMQYAESVKGLDSGVVQESADAAMALAEMAANLPNSGGLSAQIFGENNLSDFGRELALFGPYLTLYAASVSGLDAGVVEASASAAMAMAELADNLPNNGGLAGLIFGENNISEFGEELAIFGPYFASYADSIKDVDGGAVEASANAAMALAALANSLPNEGGFFSLFTGDADLASFGESLVSFGNSFADYAATVEGINTAQLDAVNAEFEKLIEFSKELTGIDTSSLSSFAQHLKELGENGIDAFVQAFENCYQKAHDTVVEFINQAILGAQSMTGDFSETFTAIVDEALSGLSGHEEEFFTVGSSYMGRFIDGINSQDADVTSAFIGLIRELLVQIASFGQNFQTAGSNLISRLITGIRSQHSATVAEVTSIITECITTLTNEYATFLTIGTTFMENLISGIRSKESEFQSLIETIITTCITYLQNQYPTFLTIGTEYMNQIISGVNSKYNELLTAFTTIVNNIVSSLMSESVKSQFYEVGKYFDDGMAEGIAAGSSVVSDAVRKVVREALAAARDESDEASPSKETYKIGAYMGEGLVNGIEAFMGRAYSAGSDIVDSAMNPIADAVSKIAEIIENGLDSEPTIKPVLDLSDLEEGFRTISTMYGEAQAMSISSSIGGGRGTISAELEDGEKANGNTYNYNQYNYSPKALSRTEIYRQTRNQFSAFERRVE